MGRVHVKKPEILMSLDGWTVERSWEQPAPGTVRPDWWHDNTKSYVKHQCPGEKVVPSVFVWPDTYKFCWRCTTPIPDGIKTVWIMHNWEAIQNEGAS